MPVLWKRNVKEQPELSGEEEEVFSYKQNKDVWNRTINFIKIGNVSMMILTIILGGLVVYMYNINQVSSENLAPSVRINSTDIFLFEHQAVIDLTKFEGKCHRATFSDTNSMLPTLDTGHHSIECRQSKEDIREGDIISYELSDKNTIIHRVREVGQDKEGWYCITQGDNLKFDDAIKIRYEQVRGTVIALIY